jgi:hypothetical protein
MPANLTAGSHTDGCSLQHTLRRKPVSNALSARAIAGTFKNIAVSPNIYNSAGAKKRSQIAAENAF